MSRVLLAGATGALGAATIPRLVAAGHDVVALTRDPGAVADLARTGATAAVADVMDPDSLRRALGDQAPEVVVHAAKAIPKRGPWSYRDMSATNRLHDLGTRRLLALADHAGAERFIAASVVFAYGYGDLGPEPVLECRPTDVTGDLPRRLRPIHAALTSMEQQVVTASEEGRLSGTVLRLGVLYGPGATDRVLDLVRRGVAVVPRGRSGLWPLVYVEDAADAVLAAIRSGPAVVNVVDDQPVPPEELLDALAAASGGRPARRLPRRIIATAAPYFAAVASTRLPASNDRAASALGWRPAHPTYRDGLRAWLAPREPAP